MLSLSHVSSSSPFSCRKTMVVHWFARNMSAKSSSVWASKGQNVPHLSLRSLLTLLSTLSGYTKSSNFTPVWRGTDVVVWKWTPCTTLPQHTKEGAALGQQIPRLLRRGPRGRNEEKSPYGKWSILGFCGWICYFTEMTEISDWRLDKPNGN